MVHSLLGSCSPKRAASEKNPAKTPKRITRNVGRSAHFQSGRPRGRRQRCAAFGARNLGALVADRCFVGDHGATIGCLPPAARRNFRPRTSGKFAYQGGGMACKPPVRPSGPDRPGTRGVLPLCYKPRGPFIADSIEMDRQEACCTSDGGDPVRGAPPSCSVGLRRAMTETPKSTAAIP